MKNVQRFEGTDWRQLLPGPEVELRDSVCHHRAIPPHSCWWCVVTADTNLNTDPFYFASYLIYDLRTSKIESRGSALLWRGTGGHHNYVDVAMVILM